MSTLMKATSEALDRTNYCLQGRLSCFLHLCSKSHRLGDFCVCAQRFHFISMSLDSLQLSLNNKSVLYPKCVSMDGQSGIKPFICPRRTDQIPFAQHTV